MPELAEVDYHRRRWNPGLGDRIERVQLHASKRVFRGVSPRRLARELTGRRLLASESHGKQMLFRFSEEAYLGVHLGMTGSLRIEPVSWKPAKHDHLVLRQETRALVFEDPRLFGRVRFDVGALPAWWRDLPPQVLDTEFTRSYLRARLTRRSRAPIKAVLLDQTLFPGIGNWMADEILWRAGIHPADRVADLDEEGLGALWKESRFVARRALEVIAPNWGALPRTWLFHRRWKDGGACPRTGTVLVRESIGGRTTCWSPGRQAPRGAGGGTEGCDTCPSLP